MKLFRLIVQCESHRRGPGVRRLLRHALFRRAVRPLTAALIAGLFPFAAWAGTAVPRCNNPFDLLRLASPLKRLQHRLTTTDPITVVAIGSSSTAGAGASSPAKSYPSQLEAALKAHFRGHTLTVLNRGVNGEEIGDMLKRFGTDVVALKPDLVLWQLGTNSVMRDQQIGAHGSLIRDGLRQIRAIGADVVLIDPQYVPRVIAKPDAERMVEFLALTAKQENIDLFRRYELMKRWYQVDHLSFDTFVSPDGLHLNDWSYACMAKGLADVIAEAAQRPVQAATVRSSR
ncbi:SGNH/GDSL hydrolase family protein [Pseudolabrys taiwanensis]|uniref:SGNH/GDSL hydrolase family protein n=1 Tax=Pseudolabrys taiwanensis TaxID=331696 RepID=UPI0013B39870|nr:SGNH/GDSL hydrolase family protein [Pseudolabrys taiwanensis]